MGLDMYLYLEDHETSETIEYSYYRKFNALLGYFEKNYGMTNCGRVLITNEIIEDLFKKMNEIKFHTSKANTLLPVHYGPFFGSYEYDSIYHSHIRRATIDFYHARFLDYNRYSLYFTADW
jgi:hypothetical protein